MSTAYSHSVPERQQRDVTYAPHVPDKFRCFRIVIQNDCGRLSSSNGGNVQFGFANLNLELPNIHFYFSERKND